MKCAKINDGLTLGLICAKIELGKANQNILESVLFKNQFQNMISRLKRDVKTGHQMQLIIFRNQIFENGIDLPVAKNCHTINA